MLRDEPTAAIWEFPRSPELATIARSLASLPHCLILSSSRQDPRVGRYSFAMADPTAVVQIDSSSPQSRTSWQQFREQLEPSTQPALDGLPPFQGGYAGLFGYELNAWFEALPTPMIDEFQIPCCALGLYDVVIAWDHLQDRCWIISRGYHAENDERPALARRRLDWMIELLSKETTPLDVRTPLATSAERALESACQPTMFAGVYSNFTKDEYCEMVATAVERIWEGELFQVNLSQRLVRRASEPPMETFLRSQRRTPAPFSCYFDLGAHQIISVSPERFLQVRNGHVEARPIKGTRRGMPSPEADLFAQCELFQSHKDQAENTMIVDLLRNDLSRVCRDDSLRVTQWCGIESHRYVHHLVSVVEGELQQGNTSWDVIRAAFPCGSVTGAPKIRAMETITELENIARGPYCGSLGYVGFDGTMDLNVLIRTLTFSGGWCQFPVGGGIVADSQPEREFNETWDKAAGILAVLTP